MASKKFPLSILIGAVDRTKAVFAKITAGISKLTEKANKAGKAMVKMGKKITTSVTLPIVAMGALAVRSFASLQDGMARANTMMRLSKSELSSLKDEVLAIGADVPKPIRELTGTLFEMASAGIKGEKTLKRVLKGSADLAVAGRGSVTDAFKITNSAIKDFNLTGQKAGQVYESVFAILEEGQLDIAQLQMGFGSTAVVVAQVGGTLEGLGASVAALTKLGMPAAEALTRIRAAMSGLSSDTPMLRKAFKLLKVKGIEELIKKTGSLGHAFKAIGSVANFSQVQLKKMLGSNEAVVAVIGLGKTVADDYAKSLDNIRNPAGKMGLAVKGMSGTVAGRTQLMKNKMAKLSDQVGMILLPFIEGLVEGLGKVAEWFGKLTPGSKRLVIALLAVAATIGPLVGLVGNLALAYGGLAKALIFMKAQFIKLAIVMMTNPITAALVLIAAAALLIYTYWGPISGFFERLWEAVKLPFVTFLKVMAVIFFTPFVVAIAAFKGGWTGLKVFFANLWNDIVAIFNKAVGPIMKVIKWTVKAGKAVWSSTKSLYKGVTGGRADYDASDFSDPAAAFAKAQREAIPIPQNPSGAAAPGSPGSGGLIEILFRNSPAGMRAQAKRGSDGSVPNVGLQTEWGGLVE